MRRYIVFALILAACADPETAPPEPDASSPIDARDELATTDTAPDDAVRTDAADARDAIPGDAREDDAADATVDAADATVDAADAADATDATVDAVDATVDAAPDASCDPMRCGAHGRCEVADGATRCVCDPAYAGERCAGCASGYFPDGHDGCTATPCAPNPCAEAERQRCTVGPTGAVCACNSGTHEEMGRCAPDVTCTATSCNAHGTCSVDAMGLRCACAPGHTGARCESCAMGFHDDGSGGCSDDPCRPSPCTLAGRTVCVAMGASARCDCVAGTHLDGDRCVADETCTPGACNGHGACSVTGGVVGCVCATGYAGARCGGCATGSHDDGAGGCTSDPCRPNPCTAARRTSCVAMGTAAVCNCDTGFHLDGMGGCTSDPCLPDPCAARNLACRNTMGAAECYAPPCNDGNPCTDDTLVGGRCTNTPRADGSACTTTACSTGQRCMTGACTGGTAVRCDDGNPCTRDRCDPMAGCAASNDDTLVPDDGVACTTDRCASGRASNTASDAVCDDGRYCTGVERCTPGAAGVDARGCVATMVPVAPALDTACLSYVCSDTTRTFSATTRTGARCDDTLACTTTDTCTAAGACVGTALAGCSTPTTCAATTALGATVDLLSARVQGTVTLGGMALPRTLTSSQVPGSNTGTVYLVARDTNVRHSVAYLYYPSSGSSYALTTNGDRVDANVPPGIYDVLYSHNVSGNSTGRYPTDPFPSGERVLRSEVVIGPGLNALSVDLPATRVQGTVTLGGVALPRTLTSSQVPGSNTGTVYLVARDTGVRHSVAYLYYPSSGSSYALTTNGDRVDANVAPGTYDVLYSHNVSGSTVLSTGRYPTDPFPSGETVLRSGVVVSGTAFTLDVDVPSARVTGTVTLDGMALPRTLTSSQVPGSNTGTVYLLSRDTNVRHSIAYLYYPSSGSSYALTTNGDRVDANVPPGTYDVLYSHNVSSGSTGRYPTDPFPSGERILRTGVVVAAGASTLDVALTTARLTGTVTLDGTALPRTLTSSQVPGSNTGTVYLLSRDTNVRHSIAYLYYPSSGSSYALTTNGDRVDANVPPGTYDVLYSHNVSSGSTGRYPTDPFPSGERVLRTGVVVAAGAGSLSVDLTTSHLTGTVTLGGVALPRTLTSSQVPGSNTGTVYLVARDTNVRHSIAYLYYPSSGSSYALTTNGDRVDANVAPGTYDLLYSHNVSSGSAGRYPTDPFPSGESLLRTGVVVSAGAVTLDVNVSATHPTGAVTLDGAALPRTLTSSQVPGSNTGTVYLLSRDTNVRHSIAYLYYPSSGSSYALTTNGDRVDANVPPGTYDLLYSHNVSSGSTGRYPTDPFPSGERLIRSCVSVP